MNKEEELINKVKRLLRRLGMPRWLHHFGPKIYEFYQHLAALLIRFYCRLSYRRIKKLLDLLGIICPSKSALQYTANKIPSWLWNKAIEITSGGMHHLIAIDSTGLSRTNPSYHYLRRIDGKMPKMYVKLSSAFDTKRKKFCSAKVRIIPRHDVKDFNYLLREIKPKIIVADKGYDSNKIHKYCYENNIKVHIPTRDYGKPKHIRLSYRKKAARLFNKRVYHRRELIESGFHSIKSKYGSNIDSKNAKTIRADVYGRLLCHNLFGITIEI
jgi:transposase